MSDESTGLPVDWDLAVRTAHRLLPPGPSASPHRAAAEVARLRSDATTAEAHVRALTGLGAGLQVPAADVVDRPGWVRAAADGMALLTNGARVPQPPTALARRVTTSTSGVQAGAVLAYLGSRVLGQYDPFGGPDRDGRLLLVAPNVFAAQRALGVPAEDFGLWVCLHESTHRLQFTAVPWLRDYFLGEVTRFLSALEDSASGLLGRLPDALRTARQRWSENGGLDGLALVEVLQGPEQRAVLDRLLALTTLLEGHADHVMDAVGPEVVPSVATIRRRFTSRREGVGLADRLLRALLGVDAKVRQYAQGSAFTRHVVAAVGMAGFNRVWESPVALPTRAEITDPAAWLARVYGSAA